MEHAVKRGWCIAAVVALALSGCASIDGRGLVPGRSTEAEVVALMGAPVHQVASPEGGRALYFARMPEGRAVYVVAISPDGVMKSIEQRLVRSNLQYVLAGTSTMKDVRDLFGPPVGSGRMDRQARIWWEYKYEEDSLRRIVWVQFSDDGVVREVIDSTDWERNDLCTPPFA